MVLTDHPHWNDTRHTRGWTSEYPRNPVHANLYGRTASVALDIIIVGGSLAGLSCAYSLRQAGHNVRVLERRSRLPKTSGGVRIPPNAMRVLLQWGLGDQLYRKGFRCPEIVICDGKSGELLSSLEFHEKLVRELQGDMYGLSYPDLHSILYDLAVNSGAQIDFGAEVTSIKSGGEMAGVILSSGRVLNANLVIGADGARSVVRRAIVGHEESLESTGLSCYTYSIPLSKMREDPDLCRIVGSPWRIWVGDGSCAITFTVNVKECGVYLCARSPKNFRYNWEETSALSSLSSHFSDYNITLSKILQLAPKGIDTMHIQQRTLDEYYDAFAQLLIVGDAAHCINPGPASVHSASLAIEDAAVLGSLFSRMRASSQSEVARLLSAFQEIRQVRWESVQRSEQENLTNLTLPEDSEEWKGRAAWFAAIREQGEVDWEDVDDEGMQRIWQENSNAFGYDACDAADDWWVDWGLTEQRLKMSDTVLESDEESPLVDRLDHTDFGMSRIVCSSSTLT